MNRELQLGKYEFFPYDEKIQRLIDELLQLNEVKKQRKGDYFDRCCLENGDEPKN